DSLRPVEGPPACKPPTVRQITGPTTLSAGEISAISGVTDERRRVKELFRHPQIIPRTVILDPAVTVHTPEWLWLSTGIRAVDHCVEGICSGEANPFADAQALHGLALLTRGLPHVKSDPSGSARRASCASPKGRCRHRGCRATPAPSPGRRSCRKSSSSPRDCPALNYRS